MLLRPEDSLNGRSYKKVEQIPQISTTLKVQIKKDLIVALDIIFSTEK